MKTNYPNNEMAVGFLGALRQIWLREGKYSGISGTRIINHPITPITGAVVALKYSQIGLLLESLFDAFSQGRTPIGFPADAQQDAAVIVEEFGTHMVWYSLVSETILTPVMRHEGAVDPRITSWYYDDVAMERLIGQLKGLRCKICRNPYNSRGKCTNCHPEPWWQDAIDGYIKDRVHPGTSFQWLILGSPKVALLNTEARRDLADIIEYIDANCPKELRTETGFVDWCGELK